MILLQYTKTDGAEFIPHLDTLRHLIKTIRRTGIAVEYSKGFNPHMEIYMSAPIGVGLKSVSEYCLIDTTENAENFKQKFNSVSPRGIKCLKCYNVNKKINIAGEITGAYYRIKNLKKFNVNEILDEKEIKIIAKHGDERDIRPRIYNLYFENDDLIAFLAFGNETLRPDYLVKVIADRFGETSSEIIKEKVVVKGNKSIEEIIV